MTEYVERYWRDAKPEDAIKEPPMVARFRDTNQEQWESGCLSGFDRPRSNSTERWWYSSDSAESFNFCQVYDAPDPGEGWRLVDIESTTRLPSDERWYPSLSKWLSPDDCYCDRYQDGCFYRRRIEQPKPEPRYEPFRWEDREQLRGRLVTYVDRNRTVEFRCESFAVDADVFSVNYVYADWLCKHAVFVDTKEPVGRKVE